jgi:hypothetical protein
MLDGRRTSQDISSRPQVLSGSDTQKKIGQEFLRRGIFFLESLRKSSLKKKSTPLVGCNKWVEILNNQESIQHWGGRAGKE